MDWMAQEQEQGITIVSSYYYFLTPHFDTIYPSPRRFNIIDTPGHVDFMPK